MSWSPACFGPVSRIQALILTMHGMFLVFAVAEASLKMDLKVKRKRVPWVGAFSQGYEDSHGGGTWHGAFQPLLNQNSLLFPQL